MIYLRLLAASSELPYCQIGMMLTAFQLFLLPVKAKTQM